MESGNSSSMQSSSGGGNGGDDDFDSRPDSSSLPFFSSSSSQPDHLPFNPNHNPSQQQPPPLSALFDHPSANFAPYDTSSMLNPDQLLWAPNPQHSVGISMSAGSQQQQHPDRDRDDAAAALMGSAGTATGSTEGGGVQTRPKKRTRASRRAPTTVLATDTSNFRAMVQQYTGIPSSPYSAAVSSSSSPFTRRLDLIPSPFSGRGGGGGIGNLFRPAAQSQHQTAAGVSSSGVGAGSIFPFGNIICDENMGTRRDCRDVDGINIFANFNSSNNCFQSLSNTNTMAAPLPRMPLGFDSLPQMTFQSLLSSQFSSMTYPSMVSNTAAAVTAGGSDVFGTQFNDQSIRVNSNSNIGVEDGLGVSHVHVGGFSGVGIGSDGTGPKNDKHDRGDNDNGNGGGNDGLATDGGNYAVNCGSSSSTTNLQRDQLVESAVAANSRGEGTLASWINSPS
ncbi:hypothetical protein Droror1_Dr00000387 [Drosera rotundifolia]